MDRIKRIAGLLAVALSASYLADAQGTSAQGNRESQDSAKSTGNSGTSMERMMAHCAEMRDEQKQGKPLSPDMQKMLKACDDMDRQMQMPPATKSR